MKTLWRIIASLIFTSFMCGLILGLFIGASAHAETLKQRFVLIYYAVADWNGQIATGTQEFASFDLCVSARKRVIEEFGERTRAICVPIEEKHK